MFSGEKWFIANWALFTFSVKNFGRAKVGRQRFLRREEQRQLFPRSKNALDAYLQPAQTWTKLKQQPYNSNNRISYMQITLNCSKSAILVGRVLIQAMSPTFFFENRVIFKFNIIANSNVKKSAIKKITQERLSLI